MTEPERAPKQAAMPEPQISPSLAGAPWWKQEEKGSLIPEQHQCLRPRGLIPEMAQRTTKQVRREGGPETTWEGRLKTWGEDQKPRGGGERSGNHVGGRGSKTTFVEDYGLILPLQIFPGYTGPETVSWERAQASLLHAMLHLAPASRAHFIGGETESEEKNCLTWGFIEERQDSNPGLLIPFWPFPCLSVGLERMGKLRPSMCGSPSWRCEVNTLLLHWKQSNEVTYPEPHSPS